MLAADQLSKFVLVTRMAPGDSFPLLPPVLSLTYVQNTGAAFGLFRGWQAAFILLSGLVVGWMLWELARPDTTSRVTRWGCALVLGGAVGNLIDRLRLGYVIDFLDLHVWPVFNIADSAITIGVTLLVVHAVFTSRGQGAGGGGHG